jgi:hypothetical protein
LLAAPAARLPATIVLTKATSSFTKKPPACELAPETLLPAIVTFRSVVELGSAL